MVTVGSGVSETTVLPLRDLTTGGSVEATAPVELVWQTRGGPDRLALPTGLAVDRRGVVTVVDAGNDRLVQLATGTGAPIARLGGPGDAPGRFRFGSIGDVDASNVRVVGGGVAADANGSFVVAEPFNARVQRLDRTGLAGADWRAASLASPLVEPAGIAVDDQRGRVYVADAGAHCIHTFFDRDGHWRETWGGPGRATGQFDRPVAVAVDSGGRVYVADQQNDRIQVLDVGGRFMTAWGGSGPQPSDFSAPVGVAVDGANRVYVATAQRILVFGHTGVFVAAWDGSGGEVDAFGAVGGIAVDEHGAIYVADQVPARVLKFRPRGHWPTPVAQPTPRPATPTATPAATVPLAPLLPTDR